MIKGITLFDRAKADLESAQVMLSISQRDELFLDIAAYHVQQGIEKLVKYMLIEDGVRPLQTHDIDILIEQMEKAEIIVPPWVSENADILNSYATKTRYGTNLIATKRKITHLLNLAEEMLQSLKPESIEDDMAKTATFCCHE